MNRKDKELVPGNGDDSSSSDRANVFVGSGVNRPPSLTLSVESDTMKRAAAKKLIERYFYQLTDGCGKTNCVNAYCASSGKVMNLTPDEAAAQAIHLFSQEAPLCDNQQVKVAKTQAHVQLTQEHSRAAGDSKPAATSLPPARPDHGKCEGMFLTEERLLLVLERCRHDNCYSLLIRTLGSVFSSTEALSQSFLKRVPDSPLDAMLDKCPRDLNNLKKEDIRTMEGDMDKDQDCLEPNVGESSAACSEVNEATVDIDQLRRAYAALFQLPRAEVHVESALVHALMSLAGNLELELRVFGSRVCDLVNVFIIALELPCLGGVEFLEMALPKLCKAATHLPLEAQARLARVWGSRAHHAQLTRMLTSLQQLITLKVIVASFTQDYCVQDEETITAPTQLLKIVYYASILAGDLDSPELRHEEPVILVDDSFALGSAKAPRPPSHVDPLATQLGVNVLDSRNPLIPFTDFYNEPLSDAIEMDKDFAYFKSDPKSSQKKFSFMNCAFILTPATKTLGLYYDNRIRMYSERRMSFFQSVVGQPTNPYLRLKVKRDHLIDDALVELEMVAMENPKDLKKQLVVEFDGEQGIDEGGVSKEFFQLIVEEIFNADYGMFTYQSETETVWFNPTSFESDAQFTLIGIVLGLAIYNNIILDVHFPMVVYRKLMGKRGTYFDLQDCNPTLFNGLKGMLEYEEDDFEDAFMQTFRICYQDVFGSTFFHELKDGGDQINVNQQNKQEFVDLYADFLLNVSVEKQFRAFRRGFQMVTDESPLHLLFRPEEIEQLVCGSKNFDLRELQEATEYDGGYTADSDVVKQFWQIAHDLPLDLQRKLLQFATGSDRVPVGGLSKLKLIIAKNGADSNRLPTAHTCFNVLLLPEYSSKEKLNDRLMKAISYSKGFGMF